MAPPLFEHLRIRLGLAEAGGRSTVCAADPDARVGAITRPRAARRPSAEPVEPRILLAADPLGAAAALGTAAAGVHVLSVDELAALAPTPTDTGNRRVELLVIDARVPAAGPLLDELLASAGAGRDIEVLLLQPETDGLQAITDALTRLPAVSAIHLVSHGAAGQVQLGSVTLDAASLGGRSADWAVWRDALTPDAQVLLYGCDAGATPGGRQLVEGLAALTGAAVAASDDLTGSPALGGDWDLEVRSGVVDGSLVLHEVAGQAWQGVLGSLTLTPTADSYIGVSAPAIGHAAEPDLVLDASGPGLGDQRLLLHFNLNAIPAGATITSATLTLQATAATGTVTENVYRVTSPWLGPEVTWNERSVGTPWSLAGGDVDPTPVATLTSGATGAHSWNVTALVDAWYRGILGNSGLMIASPSLGTAVITYSASEGTVAPTLDVQYTSPNQAPVISVDGTNQVVNGSFESGVPPWGGNSGIERNANPWVHFGVASPADGSVVVEVEGALAPPGEDSYVEQTINTVVGQNYVFTIAATTRALTNVGDIGSLSVNGVERLRFVTDTNWTSYATSFTATSTTTTLRITSLGSISGASPGSGDSAGLIIDAVSATAVNGSATVTQGSGSIVLAPGARVVDPELTAADDFGGATLTLRRQGGVQAQDVFSASGLLGALTQGGALVYGGTTIGTVTQNSGGQLVLDFSSGATAAAVNGTLQSIAYANTGGPTGAVVIEWTINDGNIGAQGTGGSAVALATTTVSVMAGNAAPTLTPGATVNLLPTDEDTPSEDVQVATLLADAGAADADPGAQSGIAVIWTLGNGTWQWSLDGVSWNAVGTAAANQALLLPSDAWVRYLPDGQAGETAGLGFRAWDRTSGNIGDRVDVSTNGGTTAFSSATAGAVISVTAANDAPQLLPVADPLALYDAEIPGGNAPSRVPGGPAMSVASSIAVVAGAGHGAGATGLLFTADQDSSNPQVTVGAMPGLNTTQAFSFAAWVRFDTLSNVQGWERVFDFGGGAPDSNLLLTRRWTTNDLEIQLYHGGVLTQAVQAPNALAGQVGQWMHLAVTADASGLVTLYVNGNAAVSFTSPQPIDAAAWTQNRIGSSNWSVDRQFRGAMDDIALYDRALTAAEVARLASPAVAVATTEQAAPLRLDALGTVIDPELAALAGGAGSYAGATLVLARAGGASADDVFAPLGALSFSAGSAILSGQTIGSVANAGGTLSITFNASATQAVVDQVMASIGYVYGGDAPPASVTLQQVFADGNTGAQGSGGVANANRLLTVALTPVNDAPVLSAAGALSLTSITEDALTNPGDSVAAILASRGASPITDGDAGALQGVAVTGTVGGRGTWQYSTDGGTTWLALGSVSDASALLLRPSDRLRYVPDGIDADTASLMLRAWDQTGGSAGGRADATLNGGTTAFSAATASAGIVVTALNDAPTLAGGSAIVLAATNEDTAGSATTVASLLAAAGAADVDPGALAGIAVTATSGLGHWEFAVDGLNWAAFGAVSGTSALLLDGGTVVRYVPDGVSTETAGLSFVAWDRSTGIASTTGSPSLASAAAAGGTTAFSAQSASASISVTAVNDAPVLASAGVVAMARITEDAVANAGDSVATILGTAVTDADIGALQGVAVTGTVGGRGTWQYSTDGGTTWLALGSVSDASALLLRPADRLRYVPDGIDADTASLVLRAWDQTSGSAGGRVDATLNGGTTAFSATTASAGIVVTALNDAPTLAGGSAIVLAATNEDTAGSATTVASLLTAAGAADVDPGALAGIAVTATSGLGHWEFAVDGLNWAAFGAVSGSSALLLDGGTVVRYVPDGVSTETAGLSFLAWDRSTGIASTTGSPSLASAAAAGGTTAFSAQSASASIAVTAVNDAPVLASAGPLSLTTLTEDALANPGDSITAILGSQGGNLITDADIGALQGVAVTGTVGGRGTWQYSTDGGTTWLALGSVSDASALLLRPSDRLRYVPDGIDADMASLVLRAWDQTSGSAGGRADATVNGGITAFSAATASAGIVVTALNDAPALMGGTVVALTPTDEQTPGGATAVTALLAAAGAADVDPASLSGIAVTGTSGLGHWEYAADGISWTAFGAISGSSALLLDAGTVVRYVPNGADAETATLSFVAWDRISGSASTTGSPSLANAVGRGGTTAFSTQSASASIIVSASNDAPQLLPVAGPVAFYDAEVPGGGSPSRVPGGPVLTVAPSVAVVAGAGHDPGTTGLLFTADLNSANPQVTLGAIPNLTTTQAFSFAAWVRFDTLNPVQGWERVFDFGGGGPGSNLLLGRDQRTDGLALQLYQGTQLTQTIRVPNALTGQLGQWMHLAVTADAAGQVTLYLQGTAVAGFTATQAIDYGSWTQNRIGASNWAVDRQFRGAMDDIALYDRALTAAEVARLASPGVAVATSEQAAPIPLDTLGTVLDPDLSAQAGGAGRYAGATLTLARVGGANPDDVFAPLGSLIFSGGSAILSGQTVGSVVSAGGTLSITFNANATQAVVDEVMASIGYDNASDAPPASVTLQQRFDDGNTGNQGSGGGASVSRTLTVAIAPANDPPRITDGAIVSLPGTVEDQPAPATTVGQLLTAAGLSDPDPLALAGMVVTGSSGAGSWQFSADGQTWFALGPVSEAQALLLDDTTWLRFVPDGQRGGPAGLVFGGWDRTAGVASTPGQPSPIDARSPALAAAVSVGRAQAALTVADINDAPTLLDGTTLALPGTDEDSSSTPVPVSTLLAAAGWTDPDPAATAGLAVIGSVGRGTWQYSLDGQAWTDLGPVSAAQALLLDPGAQLRYVPDAANGETASLQVVAWDGSSGTASTAGTPRHADASVGGGSGAFSAGTATVTLTVAGVNDAPRITSGAGAATWVVSVAEHDTAVAVVTASDIDQPAQPLSFAIAGGADAARFRIDATTGALSLIDAADFERPTDADGDNVYEVIVEVADGQGGTAHQALQVTVTDANDPPQLQLPATGTVMQRAAGGTLVAQAVAGDPDAGDSLVFSLSSTGGGPFAIDPRDGRIVVTDGTLLDPTQVRSYTLVVQVTDRQGATVQQSLQVEVVAVQTAVGSVPPPATEPSAAERPAAPPVDLAEGPAPVAVAGPAAPAAPAPDAPASDATGPLSAREVRPRQTAPLRVEIEPVQLSAERASSLAVVGNLAGPGTTGLRSADAAAERQAVGGFVAGDLATPVSFELTRALLVEGLDPGTSTPNPLNLLVGRNLGITGHEGADAAAAAGTDEAEGTGGGAGQRLLFELTQPERLASVSATAGMVWWFTRAGGLVTTALMGVPAWRQVDLLPVLARQSAPDEAIDEDPDEPPDDADRPGDAPSTGGTDDEALEAMFERDRGHAAGPRAGHAG